MSIVRVVCVNAQCQKILRIRAEQGGKQIRCPTCGTAMMAPVIPGTAAPTHDKQRESSAAYEGPPTWMTVLFFLGICVGFFSLLLAIAGFEFYLQDLEQPINKGPTAELLSGTWKIAKGDSAAGPAWHGEGFIWTFERNGKAETGRLMPDSNRYDRQAAEGFREWRWTTQGELVTMKCPGENTMTFAVAQTSKGQLELAGPESGNAKLLMGPVDAVETFPDLRVVAYGGVLAPMFATIILAWLISREVFHMGILRFLLCWPLTVLIGSAIGAGAGFLIDVLDEHSHGDLPYWMALSIVQGGIGVVNGFALSIMSCLRPTY